MDRAISFLLGFGSTTIFSTIDLMGLWVLLAMSEALTLHRSRDVVTDAFDISLVILGLPRCEKVCSELGSAVLQPLSEPP